MQDLVSRGSEPRPGMPSEFDSLVQLGRYRAHAEAGAVAFAFLKDGEVVQDSLTYSDLDLRARAVAAWLQERAAHGERVILLYPSGLEFIVAFMGCLYAGALAVPVYAPQARDEHWARLDALATDAGAKFLLTTTDLHASVGERIAAAPFLSGLSLCASDAVEDAAAAAWSDPGVAAESVAFLQYTSGSTGAPKGVMVTHGNLLHNQMLMHAAFGNDRDSVFVSWLPLFHDMGLIGNILHTLYLGARCYVMAPVAFLQQPVRWLRAISDYRGTSSFAPNFAYDLCARRVTQEQKSGLDLSCWTFALNGAEPVRADTLDRFAEAFADCGFAASAIYPGYGLAEGTLFASGGLRSHGYKVERFDAKALQSHKVATSDAGDAQPLVGSGRTWCDAEILIVDPATLQSCDGSAIGEIWLRSPSVAIGYWNKPEATLDTFGARVNDGEARYLRTGDLGFLREGELFVNGRLKELIILRGRNLYPQDIEATVQDAWEGLRKGGGAAFSVDIDGEERLVVVQEVERTFLRKLDPARVEADVRRAIAEVHEAQLYDLVLIRPATLAKTSSGKIQRRKSQRDYIDGSLDGLYRSRAQHADADASTTTARVTKGDAGGQGIESTLRRAAARVLQIEPAQLRADVSLVGQGMDSLALVEFAYAIEQAHGAIYPLEKLLAGASLSTVLDELAATTHAPANGDAGVEREEADAYPLSANQQSLWFLQKLQPDSHAYNVWLPVRLETELDPARLERAVALLLGRHRSLRCRFIETEHGPIQVVQAAASSAFAAIDAVGDENSLRETIRASVTAPIDLERELPFRVEYHAHAGGAVLVLIAHHVCVDLTSMMQLLSELAALYGDPDTARPAPRASYFQHVVAERGYLAEAAQADRDYWRAALGQSLPVLDLPKRVARPKLQSFEGDCVEFRLPADLGRAHAAHARAASSTPFSVLLTAYSLLLHRYTRQQELTIGVPVLGRRGRDHAETVGYFVNTVTLVSRLHGNDAVADHHDRIKRDLAQALAHAALPFAHVVECVQPQRDSAIPPLTQTLFNLHKAHADPELARLIQAQSTRTLALGEWTVAPYHLPPRSSQLDLSLSLVELADGSYEGRLDYCTRLFERALIKHLAESFALLLQAMLDDPQADAPSLPLLSESERRRVVDDWNCTDRDWGGFVAVDEIISRRAIAEPDAVALVHEGRSLSYAELESCSNAVAAALSARGAGAESVVGVCMRRSDRLVIALLGVMKAGAAYLPLDPGLPAARISVMTDMARPVLTLCDDEREGAVPDDAIAWSELLSHAHALAPPTLRHAPTQAAYVIYTSGSTGQPKGVVNSHEGLANRLLWMQRRFGLSRGDRVMLKTAYTFDVSVWEFFWPLMTGATIVVARHDGHRDAGYIRELIRDERVNLLHFVPSMLKAFLDEPHLDELTSLRQLVCSGEELGIDVQAQCLRKLPHAALANLYGPTEAAIDVSCWDCRSEAGELRVPIGLPIDNLRLYVLDETLDAVPVGVGGELYIGGIGLARGYIARPDLTADRFVPAPLGGRPGERLYRTGDLACYREDGAIDFLGRVDHQVKLRGLRIELGEIDSHARGCDGVADALTLLDRRRNGDGYLLCYLAVAGDTDRAALVESVRRLLAEALPAYMIPERFVLLDTFPLNASGKVDRKRLPPPPAEEHNRADAAPTTPTEERLQDFLRELLDVAEVHAGDSFFDLGGHSLLATRLCSRIRGAFGIEINVVDVLMHPVVADMAALVDARANVEATAVAHPHDTDGVDALSAAQRRLWFIEQLEGPSAAYTMPLVVRLSGPMTPAAVAAAVRAVLGRHAELRCRYPARANGPVREVLPVESIEIALEDLSSVAAERREVELQRYLERTARHVFRLDQGPLCRAGLAALSDQDLVLTLIVHHAAADGATLSMLMQQIAAELCGHAAVGGSEYGAYCRWQNAMQREGRWDAQLDYWRQRLHGMPPLLELPTDLPRPPMASGEGGVARRRIGAATTVAVERLAAHSRATEFMVFAACYQALLGRYAGTDEVSIGTAVSTRSRAEDEGVAGLFVNTLVLRTPLDRDQSFQSHLHAVRETCLGAYANADAPFDDVVGAVSPVRSLSHAPLVQAMLTVQPDVLEDCRWPAQVEAQWLPLHSASAKFDLNLLATRQGEGWLLELEYRSDLFVAESAAAMLEQFTRLLDAVATAPQTALAALELQTQAEATALVARSNRGHRRIDAGGCLHARFASLLTRIDPQSIAISCAAERLSYAALDARSNRIAHYLRGLGVGPEHRVGLCIERSLDMVVALLAILKAGGAYVPLDPHYPADRLQYMAADSALRYVLGDRDHAGLFAGSDANYLVIDDLPQDLSSDSLEPLGDEHNAAYVIYTSGSTGRPKGVVVTHANVGRLFAAADTEFAFGPDDVWSLFHSYAFDFSVWEIWGALLYGGRLAVVPYLVSRSPEDFVDFVEREGVTVLNQTPTAFQQFIAAERLRAAPIAHALRYVVFGGEKLNLQALAAWFDRHPAAPQLVNMYGITETTVHVTFRALRAEDVGSHASPIGAGLVDLRLYVLDSSMRPQAPGVPGELFVAGAGLARGYLGRPELTADRFLPDPFADERGERMYRTGDLVRLTAGGEIHYLGRIDQQVKIRGFRIELGEIESACAESDGVAQAVVRVSARDELVGYLVPEHGQSLQPATIQARLRGRLPDYMVPTQWVVIDAVPLTANGKIDLRRLPEPESRQAAMAMPGALDQTEQLVLQSWSSLLEREIGGVDDNFFVVGGNSLLATRAVAQAQRLFGARLGVRDLFDHPTAAAFAGCIRARLAGREVAAASIPSAAQQQPHPASYGQERLWFLDSLNLGSTLYTMPGAFAINGELDPQRFAAALSAVVARHEALRTRFRLEQHAIDQHQVVQIVDEATPIDVPVHDLSALGETDRAAAMQQLIADNAATVFDLGADRLLRCAVAKLSDREWLLLLNVHHIVFDGVSLSILSRELERAYASGTHCWDAPAIQFKDYAHWLRGPGQEEMTRHLAHWVGRLDGAPPVLELPASRPRPPIQSYGGAVTHFEIDVNTAERLHAACREHECTPYVMLMACYALLLSRYSGQRDLVVGTPVANRGMEQTQQLIGFFANTLPLRLQIDPSADVGDLLRQVRGELVAGLAHQALPFERLVEVLQPDRALSHSPVFQVMFVMQGGREESLVLPGTTISEIAATQRAAKFDLTLTAKQIGRGFRISIEYATDLFDAEPMRRLGTHYLQLLAGMVDDSERRLDTLTLIADDERHGLRADLPPSDAEASTTLHGRFIAQAMRTPQAIALVAGAERLSYAELLMRVRQRTEALLVLGVRPGDLVAICLPRDADLIVSMLAIQCAGAAYVPLDPQYPVERLRGILEDATPKVLIGDRATHAEMAGFVGDARVLLVDGQAHSTAAPCISSDFVPPQVSGDALAYAIYTSGSTGRPKGVGITHRNALALLDWSADVVDADDLRGVLASTSVCFDLSVYEIFLPLVRGGTVLLVHNVLDIAEISRREAVTLINTVPSAIDALARIAAIPDGVRVINLAGEPLTRPLVQRLHLLSPARVYNLYGPSEDTTYSTWALMARDCDGKPAIGRPIGGTEAYVLDESMNALPVGVAGELYLGGEGVAQRYLGRPDLTAEKFVPDPFSGRPGARLYRTGDTVREDAAGELEFIGRLDHQVKIRGFRIELGDIEHHLGCDPRVGQCAVLVHERGDGDRELVACVSAKDAASFDVAELRAALELRLPQHMLPARFEAMDALPQTPNGKIDRKALALAIAASVAAKADIATTSVELRGDTEHALAAIWRDLLSLPRVDGDSHFFRSGGHSLLAVRLVPMIAQRFGVEMPTRKIFEYPTLSALAEYIDTQKWLADAASASAYDDADTLVDEGVL